MTYKAPGASGGTFMLTLTPGIDLAPITEGRDWIFVLDTSGSMQGKFFALSEAVRAALTPDVRAFAIVSPNKPTGCVYPPALLDAIFDAVVVERGRHTSATAPNAATPEAAPHPPRLVGRAAPRPERRISTYPALHRLFGGEVWLFQLVEQVRRGHEPVVPVRRLELGQQRGEARVRHGVGRDTPAGAATISRVHHRPRRTTAGTTSRGGRRAAPTGERRRRGW